jgi:hypothetical protein
MARKDLGMGYLMCELDGNLGLWMLFLLLVVIGCKFYFCGVVEKVKELVVDYLYFEAR